MPHPLILSGNDADALSRALQEDPADSVRRLVYADWQEENDRPLAAEIIRGVEELRQRCNGLRLLRPDHLETLRGRTFTEQACLGRGRPGDSYPRGGGRAAVRVVQNY